MKKVTLDVSIIFTFFIFASQMLHTFGKVTVLRGSVLSENPNRRKLICLSEDDGGALVWNYNLIWKTYSSMAFYDLKFHELNKFNNNEIDCKMNVNEGCLESWIKNDWSLTNSIKTPMGPVLDQRWEEFKQYDNLQNTNDYLDLELPTEVKLSFSVRVSHEMHILICNGINYNNDFCYWITIGGWNNTKSVIRKCMTGVPQPGQWSGRCGEALDAYNGRLLSENEWRSFIITWNSAIRKITVYDTDDELIITYTDWKMNSIRSSNNYMFIRSDTAMLFRFHIYDFLHTTVEGSALTSPVFQFNSKMICVQLLIGLCIECDAHVMLRDYTNDKVLATVTAKGLSRTNRIHDLPMWQSVKITTNFPATNYNSYNKVVIQLLPKLNEDSFPNPLWAIANVRQCPQNGALRKGAIITSLDWDKELEYFWPNMTCQKLFYDERTVVNSLFRTSPDNLDDANCPEEKIGPQCLFSCKYDLNSNSDCQGTQICQKNGCTCAPGFSGDTCSEPCESNRYGHGCKKTCGACVYNSEERCNKVTGVCTNGCDNTTGIYIPPLCQMSVDKLATPTIISTNETTIWAGVRVTWRDEYDEILVQYSFIIQELLHYRQPWKKLFRNMTMSTTHFANLEPGTTYHIGFILNIAGVPIHSDWQEAVTKCNPAETFTVTPEGNDMIIDWRIGPNQLYSCPANSYYIKVYNTSTHTSELVVASLFPYKLQHLLSNNSFESYVTIFHKNRELFSQEIRTLEGVPSIVSNPQSVLSANTQLTLIWKPPRELNETIVRYEVILKVKEYYGCKDLKMPTPDNHTITKSTIEPTITISDLHPYTSYSAQVIVHTSQHFSTVAETIFNTSQSEIPSEVFSQLRVDDWTLLWHPPEDCTTISGPLKAKVKIHGISDAVKYFNVTKQISYYYLNLDQLYPKLNGVERYVATVYVVRDITSKENASAYQKYEFETPPKAPPKVTNLEIVEIDTRQTPAMIHLRWQSPLPPINGKLHYYDVQLCNAYSEVHCSVIEVPLNETCDLWDDYIYKIVNKPRYTPTIKVFAYNMNVTEPGSPAFVTDDMLRNTILVPVAPGNYTFTVNNNSVIDLKWLHPWKTGDHLKSFRIRIQEIFSNLRERIFRSSVNETLEYMVTQYMRNYTERLYLFPSTQYVIYIQAVTVANKSSNTKYVEIRTPSTTIFDGVLNAMVNKSDFTILLNIPSVLNDTQDSMMHIIVKGPNICEQYSEVPENLRMRAGVKKGEIAWQAAEVLTSEFAGGQFKIGDNRTYGNVTNCPLKSEGLYEIVIIVVEGNSSTKSIMLTKSIRLDEVPLKHYELWIVPIILFFVVAGAVFCWCQRKKQKLPLQLIQNDIALSQNIESYEQETNSVILNSTHSVHSF